MIDAFWFWIAKKLAEMAFGITVFIVIFVIFAIAWLVLEYRTQKRLAKK